LDAVIFKKKCRLLQQHFNFIFQELKLSRHYDLLVDRLRTVTSGYKINAIGYPG
jgi:hypothetical protein